MAQASTVYSVPSSAVGPGTSKSKTFNPEALSANMILRRLATLETWVWSWCFLGLVLVLSLGLGPQGRNGRSPDVGTGRFESMHRLPRT